MTPIIATVLRTGGWCDESDVVRLAEQVARHCGEHRFVCLTDVERIPGVEVIPLVHSWPGWWSKIELFRGGLFTGPVLFLDLDTIVLADISDMAGGSFAMLRDFYTPQRLASGVMAWTDDAPSVIYDTFRENPETHMRLYARGGDQRFIRDHTPARALQDIHTGIYSYKVDCMNGVPADARLVCLHGEPKRVELAA